MKEYNKENARISAKNEKNSNNNNNHSVSASSGITEENAAKTIQSFWLKTRSKLSKSLSLYAKDFKNATFNDIRDGINDKSIFNCINHCVARNNRAGLQLLAYSLFSGPAVDKSDFYIDLGELLFILNILFHDKTSNAKDIGVVLKDTYLKWQSILIKTKTFNINNPSKQEEKKEGFWRGLDGKSEDKDLLVNISHGGGLFHIVDFLRGRSQGYCLEAKGGLGLQVSPNDISRDLEYAVRKPPNHFDRPTIFRAKTKAKNLTPAARPYEAGLRPEALPTLENIKIIEIDKIQVWRFRIKETSICKHYAGNVELMTRILDSAKKLEQEEIITVMRDKEEKLTETLTPTPRIT